MTAPAIGHNSPGEACGATVAFGDADSTALQELAVKIRLHLFAVDSIGQHIAENRQEAKSHQIDAGRLLWEARAKLAAEQPGASFRRWCEQRFDRSYRHCQRQMAYARTPAKLTKAQKDDRERKRAQRQRLRRSLAALELGGDGQGERPSPPPPTTATFRTREQSSLNGQSPARDSAAVAPSATIIRLGKQKVNLSGWSESARKQIAAATAKPESATEQKSRLVLPEASQARRLVRPKNNKRYTKQECADAIVQHYADQFGDDDTFADPCYGDGVFARAIGDDCEWCEIDPDTEIVAAGGPRDFLDYHEHTTWGITNPSWSISRQDPPERDSYNAIFNHALKVLDNIVFLIKVQNATTTKRRKEWEAAGFGLKEIAYVEWEDAGFPHEGFPLAAIHWQRGYQGDVRESKIQTQSGRLHRYKKTVAAIVAEARDQLDIQHRAELRDHLRAMVRVLDNEEILDAEIEAEQAAVADVE